MRALSGRLQAYAAEIGSEPTRPFDLKMASELLEHLSDHELTGGGSAALGPAALACPSGGRLLIWRRQGRGRYRAPRGNLSARSIQLGTAVAPCLQQRLQRMRGPKDGTVASLGQSPILTARS
jgi:hypothetical protein